VVVVEVIDLVVVVVQVVFVLPLPQLAVEVHLNLLCHLLLELLIQ
jgi:hypothetical protein